MISIIVFIFGIVHSYDFVSNTNEIKIFDKYLDGVEQYDNLKQKFVTLDLDLQLNQEQIVQVISMFMPFDKQQRVDILTNTSNVYTIYYNKKLDTKQSPIQISLQGVSNCTSIAYLNEQYVVLCQEPSQQFILQNGTKINYIDDLKEITSIQSFYDGLAALASDEIIIFNEKLELEKSLNLHYIQVIFTKQNIYILSQTSVYMYNDQFTYEFHHKCLKTPDFMAVTTDFIYINCENIRIINRDLIITDLKALSIQTTNQYVIINGTQIYSANLKTFYFMSQSYLYPTSFDNQVITLINNKIQVQQIIGLYIISQQKVGKYSMNNSKMFVVGDELQSLNTSNPDFTNRNDLYFVDFLAGPNIQVIDGGKQFKFFNNTIISDVVTAFNIEGMSIGVVFQQNQNLILHFCTIEITENILKTLCDKGSQFESQQPSTMNKVQSTFLSLQKIVVVAYLADNVLTIFSNNQKLEPINQVVDFLLEEIFIIVMKQTTTQFYYIHNNQYYLDFEIPIKIKYASVYEQNIALVTDTNVLKLLTNSVDGYYLAFEEQFKDDIVGLNYLNNQLIVSTKNTMKIYQNRILRGQIQFDVTGMIRFAQSYTNLYIYNQTQVNIYQVFEEISFSSYLQQIIPINLNHTFLAISYNGYQMLVIEHQLLIFEEILGFIPNTIVEQDVYGHQTLVDMNFGNSQNQKASLKVKIIGDTLKLKSLECTDAFFENEIDQDKIFYGPVSRVEGNNNALVIQRVTEKLNQTNWLHQNITDLIYIGNNNRIVIIKQKEINVCSEKECQNISKAQQSCQFLQQDELSYYVVCVNVIYSGLKSNPTQINNKTYTPLSNETSIMKFNNTIFVTIETGDDQFLCIYENYKLKKNITLQSFMDIEFNRNDILVLTYNQVKVYNTNLVEQHTFDLLKDLSQQVQNQRILYNYFVDFVKVKDDQYIVATDESPIYYVFLHQDYVEILQIFTNIPDADIKEIDLIGQDILISTQVIGDNKYLSFYDLTSKTKSSLIIPYFNVIKISTFLTKSNTIRQSNENEFITLLNEQKVLNLLVEYQINDYITIVDPEEEVELIAYDLDIQQAYNQIKIKAATTETDDTEDWMIAIYVLAGFIGVLTLLIVYRCIKRYCLMKHLQFEEEKPSEFKSEYI